MTDSISAAILKRIGFSSFSEFLLPTTVKGCKTLFKIGTHRKFYFPDRLYNDFLEVMFNNRKERAELLESLVVSTKDSRIPKFSQVSSKALNNRSISKTTPKRKNNDLWYTKYADLDTFSYREYIYYGASRIKYSSWNLLTASESKLNICL